MSTAHAGPSSVQLPSSLDQPDASADLIRIAGKDRHGTAAEVAKRWPSGVPVVYIANSSTFMDASAAAAKAGAQDAPLLLTRHDQLPTTTIEALRHLQPQRVVLVGNASKISASVQSALAQHTNGDVRRLAGSDGYATAAAVASTYSAEPSTVYLASGEVFADGLTGAVAAGYHSSPVLYARPGHLPAVTAEQLSRLQPRELVVLGGEGAISDAVAKTAAASAGLSKYRRVGGTDRYGTAALIARDLPDRGAVFAASGHSFADSTAGASLAAMRGGPVLLVRKDNVPNATTKVLGTRDPRWVTVFGGTGVISDATGKALAAGGAQPGPPSAPDPSGWTLRYSTTFDHAAGWTARDETQNNDNSRNVPKNVRAGSDGLTIQGKREIGYNRPYTSGEVHGMRSDITVPNYFRAEVVAEVMDEPGLWPAALWFRPVNYAHGEIDVMEYMGGRHENQQRKRFAVTMHNEYGATQQPLKKPIYIDELSKNSVTGIHTYTIEKTPGQIKVWVDDDKHAASVFKGSEAAWWDRIMENPNREWYPRMTLQIGSGSAKAVVPEPSSNWENSEMKIHSLKLWSRN